MMRLAFRVHGCRGSLCATAALVNGLGFTSASRAANSHCGEILGQTMRIGSDTGGF
jgi:hypothetical protein